MYWVKKFHFTRYHSYRWIFLPILLIRRFGYSVRLCLVEVVQEEYCYLKFHPRFISGRKRSQVPEHRLTVTGSDRAGSMEWLPNGSEGKNNLEKPKEILVLNLTCWFILKPRRFIKPSRSLNVCNIFWKNWLLMKFYKCFPVPKPVDNLFT